MIDIVTAIRSVRAEMNLTVATELPVVLAGVSPETDARAGRWADMIRRLARLSSLSVAQTRAAGLDPARRARRGGRAAAQGRDRFRRRGGAAAEGDRAASTPTSRASTPSSTTRNSCRTRPRRSVEGEREKREEARRPPRQDPGSAGAAQGGGVIVFVAGCERSWSVSGCCRSLRQDATPGRRHHARLRPPRPTRCAPSARRRWSSMSSTGQLWREPWSWRKPERRHPPAHRSAGGAGLRAKMDAVLESNARLRRDGTRNLMDAAKAALALGRCASAQSIAWMYAAGEGPRAESRSARYG